MIIVKVNGASEMASRMRDLPKKLEGAIKESIDEMGKTTADDIFLSANFSDFTGDLRHNTKYVPRSDGTGGGVRMPLHGIFVDRARDHWVSMNRDRPNLVLWGLQAESTKIRNMASAIASGKRKSGSLYVRHHPFIDRGFARSHAKFDGIIRRHLDGAFL